MTALYSTALGTFVFGLLLGAYFGYQQKALYVDSEAVALLREERAALVQSEAYNAKLTELLTIAQTETEIVYKDRVKEVVRYVTKKQKIDSDCNITIGAQRVLNNTAAGHLSKTAAGASDSDDRPSDVRETDLIRYTLGLLKKYKDSQNRHNLLIQWHRDN